MSRLATTARTMWEVMVADPVRGGRLRLAGLPPAVRQCCIAGVVVLGGLLVSLIFNDAWRRGSLILVRDFDAIPNLASPGVICFTLLAIAVAWALILAGAALARPRVAVLVAGAFLLANAGLADVTVLIDDSTLKRVGPHVALACYFAAPALAVVASLLRARGGPHIEPPSRGGLHIGPPSRGGPHIEPPSRGGLHIGPPSRGGLHIGPPSRGGPHIGPPSRGGPHIEPPSRGGPHIEPPSRGGRRRLWPLLAAGALAAAITGFFGSHLAVYAAQASAGDPASLPRQLDGTLNGLQSFLVPLFFLAVAGLVQLNHHVAEAVATPFWDAPAWGAKLLVLGLVVVKLRYGLYGRVDHWTAYVTERGPQAVQAVAFVALLGGAAWLSRRIRARPTDDFQTEAMVYGGSLLLSTSVLISGVITNLSLFLLSRGARSPARWLDRNFPLTFISRYALVGIFAVVLVVGIALVLRRAPLGGALVVVAGWVLPNVIVQQISNRDVGFDVGFVDLLLTLVALGYLLVRWRRLDTAAAVRIGALLVFVSLVAGNGYVATRVVSRVLASFTPPAVVLIVIGVLYVVFADSAFASASSRNFPRETRALLWIGYLIFSVAVTNYVLVAREVEYRIEFDRFAFHLLALPLAVWLAVRRPIGADAA